MMKQFFVNIIWYVLIFFINITYSASPAKINCYGLPGCTDTKIAEPTSASINWTMWQEIIVNIINILVQFVAVFSVLVLIISWFMYLFSAWEEEKIKKAKNWIIWSLVWVILSISAWWIINLLNQIKIW